MIFENTDKNTLKLLLFFGVAKLGTVNHLSSFIDLQSKETELKIGELVQKELAVVIGEVEVSKGNRPRKVWSLTNNGAMMIGLKGSFLFSDNTYESSLFLAESILANKSCRWYWLESDLEKIFPESKVDFDDLLKSSFAFGKKEDSSRVICLSVDSENLEQVLKNAKALDSDLSLIHI